MSTIVLIAEADDAWRLCLLHQPSAQTQLSFDATPEDIAQAAVELCNASQRKSCEAFLAIRSQQALTDVFTIRSGRAAKDRESLMFQLEEQLPLEAEELVADFLLHGSRAFAVAVEIASYLPLIETLHQAGIPCVQIVPVAVLVAQEVVERQSIQNGFLHLQGPYADEELLRIEESMPSQWWTKKRADASSDVFARTLLAATIESSDAVRLHTASTLAELGIAADTKQFDVMRSLEDDPRTVFVHAAERVAAAKRSPWVNLRRGPLAVGDPFRELRWPIRALATSLLVFLLATAAVFFIRARRYENQTRKTQQAHMQMFADVLPGTSLPIAAMNSRLQSHLKALQATRRQTESPTTDPSRDFAAPQSAIYVLQQFLVAMSPGADLELEGATVAGRSIDVDLVVLSFSAVNQIVDRLQKRGFDIAQPSSTQYGSDRVRTRLVGDLLPNAPRQTRVGDGRAVR